MMKNTNHLPGLWRAFATAVVLLIAWIGSAHGADLAQRQAEVDAIKADLAVLRKFKKYYDHLKAHPETIATNGPILAAILWKEAHEDKTIREHAPSMTATLQEVERLAAAGHATKLALQAIDAQLAHDAELMPESLVLQKKSRLVADAARAGSEPGTKSQEHAETLDLVEQLLTSAINAGDVTIVSEMLDAQRLLAKTSTERMNAAIALLGSADQQLQADKAIIAARLVEQLDELLKNIPASKELKELTDGLDALKSRVALASAATTARQTLLKEPANAAANQAIGMHLLHNRGDWGQAILYLALGTDQTWKSLAADTIALPKDAKSKTVLAERWAALEEDPQSESKQVARDLYTQALADSTFAGFSRAAAEDKLKALGPAKVRKTVAKSAEVIDFKKEKYSCTERSGRLLASGCQSSWSADGQSVVYSVKDTRLEVVGLQDMKTKLIVTDGKDPSWSPDGKQIAFVRRVNGREEIWMVEGPGKNPQKVTQGGFPTWSGDSKSIFFTRGNNIYAATFNENLVYITSLAQGIPTLYPAISADGSKFAARTGDSLFIGDVQTGKKLKEFTIPAGRGFLGHWSPDGKRLAFGGFGLGDPAPCMIVDVETGLARNLKIPNLTLAAWSPDGKQVTFDLREADKHQLWLFDVTQLDEIPAEKLESK